MHCFCLNFCDSATFDLLNLPFLWHSSLKTDFSHPLLWGKKTGHVFPHQEEFCKKVLVAPSLWCSLCAPLRHLSSLQALLRSQQYRDPACRGGCSAERWLTSVTDTVLFYKHNCISILYFFFLFISVVWVNFHYLKFLGPLSNSYLRYVRNTSVKETFTVLHLFFYWFCLWR